MAIRGLCTDLTRAPPFICLNLLQSRSFISICICCISSGYSIHLALKDSRPVSIVDTLFTELGIYSLYLVWTASTLSDPIEKGKNVPPLAYIPIDILRASLYQVSILGDVLISLEFQRSGLFWVALLTSFILKQSALFIVLKPATMFP